MWETVRGLLFYLGMPRPPLNLYRRPLPAAPLPGPPPPHRRAPSTSDRVLASASTPLTETTPRLEARGAARLAALAAALQPMLDAAEGRPNAPLFDLGHHLSAALGLADGAPLGLADAQRALLCFAASAYQVLLEAEGEHPSAPGSEILERTLARLRSGGPSASAYRSLEQDPAWLAHGLRVADRHGEGVMSRANSGRFMDRSTASLDPAAFALSLASTPEGREALDAAVGAMDGRLSSFEAELRASVALATRGGAITPSLGPFLRAATRALGVSVLEAVAPLESPLEEGLQAQLDAGELHRLDLDEGPILVRLRPMKTLVSSMRAHLDAGVGADLDPATLAGLRSVVFEPNLLERLESEAELDAQRALAREMVVLGAGAAASMGVGALVEAGAVLRLGTGGVASMGAGRVAAARWAASSLAFTTTVSLADGQWSAQRYLRDAALMGVMHGAGRLVRNLATRAGGALPAGALRVLAHLEPIALGAGVMTGFEGFEQWARGHPVAAAALGRSFVRNLGFAAYLHGLHLGLARLSPGLAPGAILARGRIETFRAEVLEVDARFQQLALEQAHAAARGDQAGARRASVALDDLIATTTREHNETLTALADQQPELARRLTRLTERLDEVWRFTPTPGWRPAAEVEAARQRVATTGELGAPVDGAEGMIQRVKASWRSPTQRAWAESAARSVREAERLFRDGQLRTVEAVLAFSGEAVARNAREGGRRDGALERAGRPRSMGAITGNRAYIGYAQSARRVAERARARAVLAAIETPKGQYLTGVLPHRWMHTEPTVFAEIRGEMQACLDRALNASSRLELLDAVAELHWWMTQMMPFDRGSASASDIVARGLLMSGGLGGSFPIRVGAWREGVAADLESFQTPLASFRARYAGMFDPLPPAPVLTCPAGEAIR